MRIKKQTGRVLAFLMTLALVFGSVQMPYMTYAEETDNAEAVVAEVEPAAEESAVVEESEEIQSNDEQTAVASEVIEETQETEPEAVEDSVTENVSDITDLQIAEDIVANNEPPREDGLLVYSGLEWGWSNTEGRDFAYGLCDADESPSEHVWANLYGMGLYIVNKDSGSETPVSTGLKLFFKENDTWRDADEESEGKIVIETVPNDVEKNSDITKTFDKYVSAEFYTTGEFRIGTEKDTVGKYIDLDVEYPPIGFYNAAGRTVENLIDGFEYDCKDMTTPRGPIYVYYSDNATQDGIGNVKIIADNGMGKVLPGFIKQEALPNKTGYKISVTDKAIGDFRINVKAEVNGWDMPEERDLWVHDTYQRLVGDDGEDVQGFSGCFLTEEQFMDHSIMWGPEDRTTMIVYYVNGKSIEEVVTKLHSLVGKTVNGFTTDDSHKQGTGTVINTGYIAIGVSYTQEGDEKPEAKANAAKEQTVVLPASVKGISMVTSGGHVWPAKMNIDMTADVKLQGTWKDSNSVVNLRFLNQDKTCTVYKDDNQNGDTFKLGSQGKTVSYSYDDGNVTGSVKINCLNPTLRIKTAPTKTTYTEGEAFDPTGMTVELAYSDGVVKPLSLSACTVQAISSLKTSDTAISVSYGSVKTTQKITVNPVPVAPVGTAVSDSAGKGSNFRVISQGTVEGGKALGAEVAYTKAAGSAANVSIPDSVTDENGIEYKVTVIDPNAFKNDKKLTKVTLGSNVETIGNNAFSGCKKLKKVTLDSNVTTIGQSAFANCEKLTSVTIPTNVTKIDKSAFKGCKNLKKVTIKSTKITKFGKGLFKNISPNATIKVPKKMKKQYEKMLRKAGFKGTIK